MEIFSLFFSPLFFSPAKRRFSHGLEQGYCTNVFRVKDCARRIETSRRMEITRVGIFSSVEQLLPALQPG